MHFMFHMRFWRHTAVRLAGRLKMIIIQQNDTILVINKLLNVT